LRRARSGGRHLDSPSAARYRWLRSNATRNRNPRAVTKNAVDHSRPTRARVRRIRDRLRRMYGQPLSSPHRLPVDELVRTILSQNTSDSNRDRAFNGLIERFPPAEPPGRFEPEVDWAAVRDAPVSEIEAAIRSGGLARQKAPRIKKVLELIGPDLNLDWLETAPRE